MGGKDPANYSAALESFGAILKGKDGTVAQRNEAAERSAKCLEKLGRRDEAMNMYLAVLYGREKKNAEAMDYPIFCKIEKKR